MKKALDIDRFSQEFQIPRGAWIVSYADIVTLILTFFILLLSISTISQNQYDMIVQAFTGEKVGTLAEVKEQIDQVVKQQGLAGEVKTNLDLDGLEISFSNALLFDSGNAELKSTAIQALLAIQGYLSTHLADPYGMIVEGYSDDRPISTSQYASNWELSTSRAINVMNELVKVGIDRRRISIQGFAETRSATDVDLSSPDELNQLSPEALENARSANRRVVLRINNLSPKLLAKIKAKGGWKKGNPLNSEAGTRSSINTNPSMNSSIETKPSLDSQANKEIDPGLEVQPSSSQKSKRTKALTPDQVTPPSPFIPSPSPQQPSQR